MSVVALYRLRPGRPRHRDPGSVRRDDDDAESVAHVRRIDHVPRLRGARDPDALPALVAALPGVAERRRATGPATVRRGQPAPYLGLSRELGSHDVPGRTEGARGGATCQQQRRCKQAEKDGGGGGASEHDGGLVLALPRSAGRAILPSPEAGTSFEGRFLLRKERTERIFRPVASSASPFDQVDQALGSVGRGRDPPPNDQPPHHPWGIRLWP